MEIMDNSQQILPRQETYDTKIYRAYYFDINYIQRFTYSSIHKYIKQGNTVIDIGCGEQPLRLLIQEKGAKYIGLDIQQNAKNTVDLVSSATSIQLNDNCINTIVCTEVIEHISDLDKVFKEFYRILKPGGNIILTCPFFFPLHEEPYDFNRPTPYLIRELAEKSFLKIEELDKKGNAIEVISTILDTISFQISPKNDKDKTLKTLGIIVRGGLRLVYNPTILLLSKIFNNVIGKSIYVTTVAILEKQK